MKEAYIVKKSVKRNPLNPKELIEPDAFINFVNSTNHLTWHEHTKHGKRLHERYPNLPFQKIAFLNFDATDESSFVQLTCSKRGYLSIQFDYKSTKKNLHDLIDLAQTLDSNLWQYKPKRQVLTHKAVDDRYKRVKPIAKKQTQIIQPENWLFFKGDLNKFEEKFRITKSKIKATLSRVNKANTSNNSIVILNHENDKYFVTGKALKYLYEPEFNKTQVEELRVKFENNMKDVFENVQFKSSTDSNAKLKLENLILKQLNQAIMTKSEITIGKVQKKLF